MKYAILLISLYTNYALASERITTATIDKMEQIVTEEKAAVGNDNILVVYNFYNILMAMNQSI